MELAFDFFKCLHDELTKEINLALQSEVLAHHNKKERGMGYVLNTILQESIIRYFGLRAFYSTGHRNTRFETEFSIGNRRRIDLVVSEDDSQYAFEFKRWQTREDNAILKKDLENLKIFMSKKSTRFAFEIIFTLNDHSDRKNPDQKYYEKEFEKTFKNHFHLLDVKVNNSVSFTTCFYLAQPLVEG